MTSRDAGGDEGRGGADGRAHGPPPPHHQALLLRHASVLAGPDLEYVPDACIEISDGVITSVTLEGDDAARADARGQAGAASTGTAAPDTAPKDLATAPRSREGGLHVDCRGLLLIPGLINCHTHIGDSVGKDARMGGTVDDKIHPVFGLKPRILSRTPPDMLVGFMRNSCASMIRGGITTFVDFREGGVDGVRMLRRALADVPIRCFAMGRVDQYHDADEVRANAPMTGRGSAQLADLLRECDGVGISGANENSDAVLDAYSRCDALRAIHASETEESVRRSEQVTGTSETVRALRMRPHFLVHMTHASDRDLDAVAASGVRGIVACPRANSALAEGLPDMVGMISKSGRRLALGTDNVMVNSPDMFREMDYAWKVCMGLRKQRMDPAEILKMATVNAGHILGSNIGQIAPGMLADCVLIDKHSIDLEPMHNPHAAVVHRASQSSVRAVMVGGSVVHGRIG